MVRTSAEILEELQDYQDSLRDALELDSAVLILDLQFFADRVKDLKQELRTAQAVENSK